MKNKKNSYLLIILLIPCLASSQSDSNYVVNYYDNLIFKSYLETINSSLVQHNKNNPSYKFIPNQQINAGLSVYYRWFSLGYGQNVIDIKSNEKYGRNSQFIIGTSIYLPRHKINLTYTNYTGFYLGNVSDLDSNWSPNQSFPSYPNFDLTMINLNYNYIFNGKKFTFGSFLYGDKAMIKSAGSFMVGSVLKYHKYENDSQFAQFANNNLTEYQKISSFKGFSPVVTAGYSYGLVFSKKISCMASLNLGLSYDFQKVGQNNLDYSVERISYQAESFLAAMYNQPKFFVSFVINSNIYTYNLPESSFINTYHSIMLNVGYRIQFKERPKWIGNKIWL